MRASSIAIGLMLLASARALAAPAPACEIGSYRLADGTSLDIGPGPDDGQLRWRLPDGRTGALTRDKGDRWSSTRGWTKKPDGHRVRIADCGREIRFDDHAGKRESLRQTDVRFQGSGVELAGRLTLPPGDARVPIVVLVHGSEDASALLRYAEQRQFAAAGIGTFVYDKRGTGISGGRYTQNYLLLATDAVLAAREARRLAGARAGRIGYHGTSQGGWIAPLAAQMEPVDFVLVSYGLAVSPLDEDREAIAADLERAGFGPDVRAKAMEIADAVAAIIDSGFRDGYAELETVKRKYGAEPWFKVVRGNVASFLLTTPEATVRTEGPALLAGIPGHYDPRPVLANLDVPQLWVLGGQDRDAPPAETLRRLAVLRDAGRPITTTVFPDAEHGLLEFETTPEGERASTRQPDGYFALMRDFIFGRALASSYGNSTIVRAK